MSRALIIHQGLVRLADGSWHSEPHRVLQSTPILRVLADHEVSWLTSTSAAPLLWSNPLIERVITGGWDVGRRLTRERFDLVLNLDPTPGACALAGRVRARRRAGYLWDHSTSSPRLRHTSALGRPLRGRTYQDWLFALIDRTWSGERYVLGYRPRGQVRFDIGLAWGKRVGEEESPAGEAGERMWWSELHRRLKRLGRIALPLAGAGTLECVDWVHSCRLIVAGEGLVLHAALALGRPVVALLQADRAETIHLYNQGIALTPPERGKGITTIPPTRVEEALLGLGRQRRAG